MYYYREYGYAPRGEKVFGEIAGKKFGRTNLLAAKLGNRLLAPMYDNESTDSAVFEVRFERRFMPLLSPGHVAIMDNASFHRKAESRKIAARYQVRLLFLPPYSPDLNPIEKHGPISNAGSKAICANMILLRTLWKPLLIFILKWDYYINPSVEPLEKVEKIIKLAFEHPKSLKYRDQFGKNRTE